VPDGDWRSPLIAQNLCDGWLLLGNCPSKKYYHWDYDFFVDSPSALNLSFGFYSVWVKHNDAVISWMAVSQILYAAFVAFFMIHQCRDRLHNML
jgi:hypothetical protein